MQPLILKIKFGPPLLYSPTTFSFQSLSYKIIRTPFFPFCMYQSLNLVVFSSLVFCFPTYLVSQRHMMLILYSIMVPLGWRGLP